MVLTTMAAEFAYNTNVGYHLALNERDRLKAQYLAQSAYRFMLIELKFDKMFRQVVEKQNLGQYLGGSASLPLCQQFPISTQLIRAVFLGGGGGEGVEGAEGVEGEAQGVELPEEFKRMVSISEREGAEEFLDFEGDFDGECVDESTRINLNSFFSWRPDKVVEGKLNDYDQFKEFLTKYLSDPSYEDLFEKADIKPADVVRNIADWVDTNERINEMGGVAGAPEDTLYERKELRYPLKNSKFTTPEEIYLVEGVVDDWFFPIEDRFTIYGDEKIDVCSAGSDVVLALIRRYVESKTDAPPINFGDVETTDKLLSAIMDGCSQGGTGKQIQQNVSQALEAALLEIGGTPYGAEEPGAAPTGEKGFAKYMATERKFFTLSLVGMVGDTAVTIKATVDVQDKDPNKWKLLYWRVR